MSKSRGPNRASDMSDMEVDVPPSNKDGSSSDRSAKKMKKESGPIPKKPKMSGGATQKKVCRVKEILLEKRVLLDERVLLEERLLLEERVLLKERLFPEVRVLLEKMALLED